MGIPGGFEERLEMPRCANCRHVFVYSEHDELYSYYCHHDRSHRPLCLSGAMGEMPPEFHSKTREEILEYYREGGICDQAHEAWDKWAAEHSVLEVGICPAYEQKGGGCAANRVDDSMGGTAGTAGKKTLS